MTNTTSRVWLRDVDQDGVLTFPDDLIEQTGWEEGDTLEWHISEEDGSITLTKVDPDGTKGSEI